MHHALQHTHVAFAIDLARCTFAFYFNQQLFCFFSATFVGVLTPGSFRSCHCFLGVLCRLCVLGLADPVVVDIARQHDKTAAQIVLRWSTQSGFVAIPKSADRVRLQQNLSIFEFSLTEEDMQRLSELGRADPDMLDADLFGH